MCILYLYELNLCPWLFTGKQLRNFQQCLHVAGFYAHHACLNYTFTYIKFSKLINIFSKMMALSCLYFILLVHFLFYFDSSVSLLCFLTLSGYDLHLYNFPPNPCVFKQLPIFPSLSECLCHLCVIFPVFILVVSFLVVDFCLFLVWLVCPVRSALWYLTCFLDGD